MRRPISAFVLAASLTSFARAAVLEEPFDYAAGSALDGQDRAER